MWFLTIKIKMVKCVATGCQSGYNSEPKESRISFSSISKDSFKCGVEKHCQDPISNSYQSWDVWKKLEFLIEQLNLLTKGKHQQRYSSNILILSLTWEYISPALNRQCFDIAPLKVSIYAYRVFQVFGIIIKNKGN